VAPNFDWTDVVMDLQQQKKEREFLYTSDDFARIRQLIYQRAGISLSQSKSDMVYSRLARQLRSAGLQSFADYLDRVENGDGGEWQPFVNALTTNLTSFFREPHHFPLLVEHLEKISLTRPIRLWSCAASTGEEPYSMAMTVVDLYQRYNMPVKILATDLDTNVLEIARRGVYPLEKVDKLPPTVMKRHFLKGSGAQLGFARIRPELQELISFRQLNLLSQRWPMHGQFDAIFCRNVMIYFDKATQRRILGMLAARLRPDGLLFAGHSESFHYATEHFQACGKTVYRLRESGR